MIGHWLIATVVTTFLLNVLICEYVAAKHIYIIWKRLSSKNPCRKFKACFLKRGRKLRPGIKKKRGGKPAAIEAINVIDQEA